VAGADLRVCGVLLRRGDWCDVLGSGSSNWGREVTEGAAGAGGGGLDSGLEGRSQGPACPSLGIGSEAGLKRGLRRRGLIDLG
jgi:hypothetical protein